MKDVARSGLMVDMRTQWRETAVIAGQQRVRRTYGMTSYHGTNGRRDLHSMREERDILERHVDSMRRRLDYLDNTWNVKRPDKDGDPDQLSLKIEEVSEQVPLLPVNVDSS